MYLKDNCNKYNTYEDLLNIFKTINKTNPYDTKYLNDMFSPSNVMNQFKTVFID